MNPDTASLSECCDALAEFKGWKRVQRTDRTYGEEARWLHPDAEQDGDGEIQHGIVQSLDSIAGALPESWMWRQIEQYSDGWYVTVQCGDTTDGHVQCESELLSRARAAVKAWMVVKGNA